MNTTDLILYKNAPHQNFFVDMTWVMEHYEDEFYNKDDVKALYFECVNELVELSAHYGLEGNLWHAYLAFVIANDENAFSTACEMTGKAQGSIWELAKIDFAVFRELFAFDLAVLDQVFHTKVGDVLKNYKHTNQKGNVFNKRIRDRICELACHLAEMEDEESFAVCVAEFYKEFGVGSFGLHKAFRIKHDENDQVMIDPITCTEHRTLSDLVGYEIQKKKLIDNTKNFIDGKPANNVLLFGDSGTGKSSSIKAILNEYYAKGLRMIEVYKHQFRDLSSVIAQIKDRNYKFIIYMDDLSFEEFEIEYKYLKAVIEGGLERRPDNVLIYATSNRRHLIKESFNDTDDYNAELHSSDTVQEKLSLVARFGVTIYYGSPNKKQFQNIVRHLAEQADVRMDEAALMAEANKWELSHGGLSGRTAQQFIDYIKGQEDL
ncbi:MAG: ATP-binding protein [Clostridiales bacterium]|nr:ATP-binding protein [Clostridiales bacterium]